ncbi:adenosylcobinamide-GDP ribazoletransferase [Crenobacter cavernae]|uniref:Adenosylcobinamide-GDP ribazoletransferase n=1 Tax=Crenobacter cavernae TaxID=2290923 RepID=A0A345Y583_9NEIS|nr:adenosylcobinamide-GDP ribazoletransferase [Crenobacter cavernae]AXK39085.1 adenosylcobinamide-GDP ribazoletransferase [Crenobacter cavernae]
MRSLILALQFLTRLPTPRLETFEPRWLADSARWFGVVGLIVGGLVAGALGFAARLDPWAGALVALWMWVWVTGGLHLDGLADLADARGAAHRSRERFLEVLKDPHVGSFGVLSLVMAVASKLVLLMLAAKGSANLMAVALVPAWARCLAVLWSTTLPPLAPGSGERFAWTTHWPSLSANLALLTGLSAWFAPALIPAALVAGYAWWNYLKKTLGGMTGDCLGAGIELVEIALLAALVTSPQLLG